MVKSSILLSVQKSKDLLLFRSYGYEMSKRSCRAEPGYSQAESVYSHRGLSASKSHFEFIANNKLRGEFFWGYGFLTSLDNSVSGNNRSFSSGTIPVSDDGYHFERSHTPPFITATLCYFSPGWLLVLTSLAWPKVAFKHVISWLNWVSPK
jgi:hypothetical protein